MNNVVDKMLYKDLDLPAGERSSGRTGVYFNCFDPSGSRRMVDGNCGEAGFAAG